MTFLNPWGLLALIGIPIIIIIYILRNKFNELTVPSTYLWELSEKFFKRRNPLSGLTGIISLILQLLMVAMVALLIARPIFVLPDSAGEYCFVLDGSGSMQMTEQGRTRYERAKSEIENIINSSADGSTFTLVNLSGETTVTYERITDKKVAVDMLHDLECSDGMVNYSDALAAAQSYFDDNSSFMVYLVTDKSVSKAENLEIVNVGLQNTHNNAIYDVTSEYFGGELSVKANVASYGKDTDLEVLLYVNGESEPKARETLSLTDGVPSEVSFKAELDSYASYRIAISGSDALEQDDEFIEYNHESDDSYKILIVSDTPFFLQAALDVLTDAPVDTVKPSAYNGNEGYGLYIFQSYTPKTLPDAAVWLINSSANVDDSGFGARGIVELDRPEEITMSTSSAGAVRKLLDGVSGKDIFVSEYVKYSGMYTKFTTIFSHGLNPLIFAGVNGLGNREVVIGFDIHKADFALSTDFVALLGNLLSYSCPSVVEEAGYSCGEDAEVNITAQIKNVKATSPSGKELYIDTSRDVGAFRLDEVGTYTVDLTYSGVDTTYKLYSSAPVAESDPTSELESFSLSGEREYEKSDGTFDPIVIILIILALTFTADWMVYCYEKYQLR